MSTAVSVTQLQKLVDAGQLTAEDIAGKVKAGEIELHDDREAGSVAATARDRVAALKAGDDGTPKPAPKSTIEKVIDAGASLNPGNIVSGQVRGILGTLYHVGKMAGVVPQNEDFEAMLHPDNLGEGIGKLSEQAAEFAGAEGAAKRLLTKIPVLDAIATVAPLATKVATGAAVGGAVTAAQGGDAKTGAAVGAAAPAAEAIVTDVVGPWLKSSAASMYQKVLGATGKAAKANAEKVAPRLLSEGVRGSRAAIEAQTTEKAAAAAAAIDDAWGAIPDDAVISSKPIVDSIKSEIGRLQNLGPEGVKTARTFKGLQKAIEESGDDAGMVTAKRLREVRQFWDDVVGEGYATGALNASQKAHKYGANAIRAELYKEFPDLAAINAEYTFWKRAGDVISATNRRVANQTGLVEPLAAVAGGAAGLATGGPVAAAAKAAAMKEVAKALRSGWFKSANAVSRDRLANAIASSEWQTVTAISKRIAQGVASARTTKSGAGRDQ